jgi:hypothetical protein
MRPPPYPQHNNTPTTSQRPQPARHPRCNTVPPTDWTMEVDRDSGRPTVRAGVGEDRVGCDHRTMSDRSRHHAVTRSRARLRRGVSTCRRSRAAIAGAVAARLTSAVGQPLYTVLSRLALHPRGRCGDAVRPAVIGPTRSADAAGRARTLRMGAARANEPVRLAARNVVREPCTARAWAWRVAISLVCDSLSLRRAFGVRAAALLHATSVRNTHLPVTSATQRVLCGLWELIRRSSLRWHVSQGWWLVDPRLWLRHRPSVMSTTRSPAPRPLHVCLSQRRRPWPAWCSEGRWRGRAEGAHSEAVCVVACDVRRTRLPPPPTNSSPTGASQQPAPCRLRRSRGRAGEL